MLLLFPLAQGMRLTVAAAAPTPDQFLHTLLHQLAPHLVNAPAADLATVLQQLGALRYVPPEPWLTGVLSGAEGKLAAAGDQVSGVAVGGVAVSTWYALSANPHPTHVSCTQYR